MKWIKQIIKVEPYTVTCLWNDNEIRKIDAPTAVLIILHAISGIESWHRSKAKISAEELEENMLKIMIDGLRKP